MYAALKIASSDIIGCSGETVFFAKVKILIFISRTTENTRIPKENP